MATHKLSRDTWLPLTAPTTVQIRYGRARMASVSTPSEDNWYVVGPGERVHLIATAYIQAIDEGAIAVTLGFEGGGGGGGGGDDPEAPNAPDEPEVEASGETSLRVVWGEPFNGGSPITGYNLRYSTDKENWEDENDVNSPYVIEGLPPNTLYYVEVQAVNAVGAGPYSTPGEASTEGPAETAPGKVTGLQVTAKTATSVNLSWAAPSDGGSPITNYNIYGDSEFLRTASGTTTTVTDLSPETEYNFEVSAVNSVGEGEKSAAVVVTTEAVPDPGEFDLHGPSSSIEYRGVTFNFSTPVMWMESANGDPVVISHEDYLPSGSEITSITPEGQVNSADFKENGAMINPSPYPRDEGAEQGFDSGLGTPTTAKNTVYTPYLDEANVDPGNTSQPIPINTGESFTVVKSVRSVEAGDELNKMNLVGKYVPLTIMGTLPPTPGEWFRPSMSATVKEWPLKSADQMDFAAGVNSPLRNLPKPPSLKAPSEHLATIITEDTHNIPMWIDTGEKGRRMYLSGEGGGGGAYSEESGMIRGAYLNSIFCDWTGDSTEQEAREELAKILIQWGIDRDGAHQAGQVGGGGAGQYYGYHPFMYLAGFMLGDTDILDRAQRHSSNTFNQTFWIDEQLIGYPNKWDVGSVGGSHKRVSETYHPSMLGMPEWTRSKWTQVGEELPARPNNSRDTAAGQFTSYRDTNYNTVIVEAFPVLLLRNGPDGVTGLDVVNREQPVGPSNIASAVLPYIDRSITFVPAPGRFGHKGVAREMYDLWRDDIPQAAWEGAPDSYSNVDLPLFSPGSAIGTIDVDLSTSNYSTKDVKRREVSYSQDGIQFSDPITVDDVDTIENLRPGTEYWNRWRQVNIDDEIGYWSPTWFQCIPGGSAPERFWEVREKVKTSGAPSGPITNIVAPRLMKKPYPSHPMPYYEPADDAVGVTVLYAGIGLWQGGDGELTPTYQWQRNTGSGWDNIVGATEASYTLHPDDVSHDVRCQVEVNGSPAMSTGDVTIPEPDPLPANVIIDTPFDESFPLYWPDVFNGSITTSGDTTLEPGTYWGELDVPPGGFGVTKTASTPWIDIPLGDLDSGSYRVQTTIVVGMAFAGAGNISGDWQSGRTSTFAVRSSRSSSTDGIIESIDIQPNPPGEPYLVHVDITWEHTGGDCWLTGRLSTNIGGIAGSGSYIFADRLLVTKED